MNKRWSAQEITKQLSWLRSLIIFEDSKIVAINKPRGIPVQGGSNIKFSLDDVLHAMEKPWKIVHRLDRETTGVLIFAKNSDIAKKVCKKFQDNLVNKTYLATVHGKIEEDLFTIDQPLLEKKIGNEKLMMVDVNGKNAITHIKLLKYNAEKNQSLLELKPVTGRKHQLRVHLNFIDHPIVGDQKYNFKEKEKIMMLHAKKIEFSLGQRSYDIAASLPEN